MDDDKKIVNIAVKEKNKIKDFFVNNIIDIAFFVGLVVFIAVRITTVKPSQNEMWAILGDSALTFVFAYFLSALMRHKGEMTGMVDELMKSTMRFFSQQLEKIDPYIDNLDSYCEEKNELNLKKARSNVLRGYGISYSKYESIINGTYDKRLTDIDIKAVKKANSVGIHNWTVAELTSEATRQNNDYSFGMTISEFKCKTNLLNLILTIVACLVFGYFSLSLIDGFSLSVFIWACCQATFLAAKSILAYVDMLTFIKGEFRNRIIAKGEALQEFYVIQTRKHQ